METELSLLYPLCTPCDDQATRPRPSGRTHAGRDPRARGLARTHGFAKQPKKAAASGWIGSALEYYDFFIYAQAAALVFPNIFFPKGDPQIAIIAAFATFGVGYVARPIGAFVLGHLGDTHGRKNMLVLCMMLIGISTFGGGVPADLRAGRACWPPALLVILRLVQGFAVGGEIAGRAR